MRCALSSRRTVCLAALAVLCSGSAAPGSAAEAPIRLWSGPAPGEQGELGPERFIEPAAGQRGDIRRLTDVSVPTLTLYTPPKGKATGTALIVAPGGGYSILAWEHEGEDLGRWYSEAGITTFVLKYRVPKRAHDPQSQLPLMDAQRAVSLVRHRAKEWGIDPQRIGIAGFSAGGHLAANLSTNYEQRAYSPADEIDRASCRPDFAILVYPGGMLDRQQRDRLNASFKINAQTPPTFVTVAADDRGSVDGSVRYWIALKDAGVKSELHVYAGGGHGYGIRPRTGPAATWPQRSMEWLRGLALVPAEK